MPTRLYPDDREANPDQLTFREFVQEACQLYQAIEDGDQDDELTFLKFVLAGHRGLDPMSQCSITINALQGIPDIQDIRVTHDFDSLIGLTRTLPYLVPLMVWPVPPFRETLKVNNHVMAVAINSEVSPSCPPSS